MDKDVFADHYKPLEERYRQIMNTVELQSALDIINIQQQSSEVVLHDAKDLYMKWDTLDFEAKRNIVELITEVIIVGAEDIDMKASYLPIPPRH